MSLLAFGVPGAEFVVARHFFRVGLGIHGDVDDARLTAGVGPLDGGCDVFVALDVLAVASEAFRDLVEAGFLAPMDTRLERVVTEGALVDAYFESPGVVDTDDTD